MRGISRRRAAVAFLLIAAFAVRVALVERTPGYRPINDPSAYLRLAGDVGRTGDYSTRHGGAGGTRGATAYFPPGYPYFLAAVDLLDGHRDGGQAAVEPARLVQAGLGTVTVALVGLVALEAFEAGVALLALGLAAFYPPLIALGGTLCSEVLLVPLELGSVYAALRAGRGGDPPRRHGWIVLAGALSGLATLTHENAAVLLVPLVAAAWSARPRGSWPALAPPALLLAAAALTIAPWAIRNAVVMHRLIPVADEDGISLAGTYNARSAADPRVPYRWLFYTEIPANAALGRLASQLSEPELGDRLRSKAIDYVGEHPFAPLAVAYHNTRRLLELEGAFAWQTSGSAIGIQLGLTDVAAASFWILAVLAALGAFTSGARAAPRWLWLCALLFYLSVVFVNAETPRFRAPIDPFLLMLAALALAALVRRRSIATDARGAVAGVDARSA